MAVLPLHNLAVHRLLPAPGRRRLELASVAGLSAFAGHAGCSRPDLGIGVEDAGRGLRMGLGAAAVAVGGGALGGALPATRRFFGDRQVSDVGRSEAAYHVAVRIPLATALAEEVLFRGVLLAMFRQRRPPVAAVLWTSLLFGAWHVLPTIDHYQAIPRATWWPTRAEDGGWPCWRPRCPRPELAACSRGCRCGREAYSRLSWPTRRSTSRPTWQDDWWRTARVARAVVG